MIEMERVKVLCSIIQRGHGQNLMARLQKNGIPLHYQCVGQGTAPSEILDILGLGSTDKDILISFGPESALDHFMMQLHSAFPHIGRTHGLLLLLSPVAVSKLLSVMVQGDVHDHKELPGGHDMKYEFQNSLICISVNLGYTDQVMHTARKAGATGGTVIKARITGDAQVQDKIGVDLQVEKELILILAPNEQVTGIMNAVNSEFGLRTPAQALLHCLPVDHALKV